MVKVALDRGVNELLVVAVNEGGEEKSPPLNLTYVPPPVRIQVIGLESAAEPGRVIAPTVADNNQISLARVRPDGKARLHGRVTWPDRASLAGLEDAKVRVEVNGSREFLAPLRPSPGNELESQFRADLVLDRLRNRVVIRLPGVAGEAGDTRELEIACLRPIPEQKLHLLIIGVGQEDEETLRRRALDAILVHKAKDARSSLASDAFEEIFVYGPLCGDVAWTAVSGLLGKMAQTVRKSSDVSNSVLAIYYQGVAEDRDGDTYFQLRTGKGRGGGESFTLKEIIAHFRNTPAPQLVFSDVSRAEDPGSGPVDPAALGDDERRLVLLRYSWWPGRGEPARPEHPPEEARLINSLPKALAEASTLGKLKDELLVRHGKLTETFPNSTFEHNFGRLAPGLLDLRIGKKRDGMKP
jgi:hypothetical protein